MSSGPFMRFKIGWLRHKLRALRSQGERGRVRGLSDFFGTYQFTRRIDQRAGGSVHVTGQAVISQADGGAMYHETGRMVINGQSFDTQQSYGWRAQAGRIFVSFSDGRPFHDFDPELGGTVSEHLCGADIYRGGYDFSRWPRWSLIWDVSGPRKDYRSVTTYVPSLDERRQDEARHLH